MNQQAQSTEPKPQAQGTTQSATATSGHERTMRQYLDRALSTLDRFGLGGKTDTQNELINLLEDVKHLDEAKVLAIAEVLKHMSTFNQLVRDNVENITFGNRYLEISQMFDSIREDSKRLIDQLDDGKFSASEKVSNWWMRIRRGTPSDRFNKIEDLYRDVSKDTKEALTREQEIMDAYIDFRFALKEAEVLASELYDLQVPNLEAAKAALAEAQAEIDSYTGTDEGSKSRLQLRRDQARQAFQKQDETYQLLKDITENLRIGYDVGETLVTKLKQTNDVKTRVYRRAVTFFTTNEHVFTILRTVYTSQYGLNEITQATEAMKEGVNRGLEDVATLGANSNERRSRRVMARPSIQPVCKSSSTRSATSRSNRSSRSLRSARRAKKRPSRSAPRSKPAKSDSRKRLPSTLAVRTCGSSRVAS